MTLLVPATHPARSKGKFSNGWDKTHFVRAHAAGLVLATNLFGAEPTDFECPTFVEYGDHSLESRIEFAFSKGGSAASSSADGPEHRQGQQRLSISYRAAECTKVISAKAIVEFSKARCDLQSGKIRSRINGPVSCDSFEIPRVSPFEALDIAFERVLGRATDSLSLEPQLVDDGLSTSFQAAANARNLLQGLIQSPSSEGAHHPLQDL